MNPKQAEILVHVACVAVIAACLTLACTVLAPFPWAARIMVISAVFIYGKLGFAPADPVLARILQGLDPVKVAVLSQRPPAPLPNPAALRISVASKPGQYATASATTTVTPITHPPADDETPVRGPDKGAA